MVVGKLGAATAAGAVGLFLARRCFTRRRAVFKLWYWPILGRGEFVRLTLAASGAAWEEIDDVQQIAPRSFAHGGSTTALAFAPPILELADGSAISQSTNCMMYIGEQSGLVPASALGRALVNQLVLTVADVVAEAHETHHPVSVAKHYEEQMDAAVVRSKVFCEQRMPKFLGFLEETLRSRGGVHMCGSAYGLTVADIAVMHLLDGLAYAFPNASRKATANTPLILRLAAEVKKQKGIAAYLASPRRRAFNESGIFRRYPELDLPE